MILPLLITYLGLACGVAIGMIAREELSDGERYFKILQGAIAGGIAFFITYFFIQNALLGAAAGMILGGAVIYAATKTAPATMGMVSYAVLPIPFFIAYKAGLKYPLLVIFPAVASLVFLYGFPTGSLLLKEKVPLIKIFLYTSAFIPLSLILFYGLRSISL